MGSLRALVLAGMLVPAIAGAQPSAKDKQKAGDLVKQAIANSQAGEHEAAAELYLDAYKVIPQPLLLSNIGSEYQQLKRPVEALKYFCKYIEADRDGSNASYALAQARTLYIELGGVTTVTDDDVCKPIVKPAPEPAPVPEPVVGPSPTPEPEPGPVDRPSSFSPLRLVAVGVGVIGAGVFGAGVYYGLQAQDISDEITNHPMTEPWDAMIKQREAEGKSAENKQIGFMIGGGVAIAAGTALFFLASPNQKSDDRITVAPLATPDTLGFTAAGRF